MKKRTIWSLALALSLGWVGCDSNDENSTPQDCETTGTCSHDQKPDEYNEDGDEQTDSELVSVVPRNVEISEVVTSSRLIVQLNAAPTADVHVVITVNDPSEVALDRMEATFTSTNWQDAASFVMNGVDDQMLDGDQQVAVLVELTSDDARFDDLSYVVDVNVVDDGKHPEGGLLVLTPESTVTDETGKSVDISLKMTGRPTHDVVVSAMPTNSKEAKITPENVTFPAGETNVVKTFTVTGIPDELVDGDANYKVRFTVTSEDSKFDHYSLSPITLTNLDKDSSSDVHRIRLMAANITSGSKQMYEDPGIRIFKALQPDIIMIQEFGYAGSLDNFVQTTFGEEFVYATHAPAVTSPIPNGIISRYPIIEDGFWRGSVTPTNRNYDWAVIKMPGNLVVLAVSVHLLTDKAKHQKEMPELATYIQDKLASLKAADPTKTYVAMIGGDFNTRPTEVSSVESAFEGVFATKNGVNYPVDQNDNRFTSNSPSGVRDDPYDWLLVSPNFDQCEIPIVIGEHTYPNGHVFDSRVYGGATGSKNKETIKLGCAKHNYVNELADLPSVVKISDSGATNMQHMAVIRDFVYTTYASPEPTDTRCRFY